jgi:hypothetical protein
MFSSQNPASSSPWAQLQRVWIYRSQGGLASGRSGQQTRFTSWHTRRTDFCLPQPQSKTGLWGSGTKITSVSTKWILYSRGSQPFINRVLLKEQKKCLRTTNFFRGNETNETYTRKVCFGSFDIINQSYYWKMIFPSIYLHISWIQL